MSYVYGDKVHIKRGIFLDGDNRDVDAIQQTRLVGMVVNVIEHPHYPIKVNFGDGWGIYPFAEDELERVEPTPAPPNAATLTQALATARTALERISGLVQEVRTGMGSIDRMPPDERWQASYWRDVAEAAASALAQLAALEKEAGE